MKKLENNLIRLGLLLAIGNLILTGYGILALEGTFKQTLERDFEICQD